MLFIHTDAQSVTEDIQVLARRVAESDKGALEQLYRLTVEPLVRYLMASSYTKENALDLVHDTFLALWESRSTLRIHTSIRAYLYTAVRNRALNAAKRESRSESVDFSTWRPVEADTTQDSVQETEELNRFLRQCISELPTRRGEALMLSRFHDLSHADIARIMNLSERTVNTHVQHALRDLRARLATHLTK